MSKDLLACCMYRKREVSCNLPGSLIGIDLLRIDYQVALRIRKGAIGIHRVLRVNPRVISASALDVALRGLQFKPQGRSFPRDARGTTGEQLHKVDSPTPCFHVGEKIADELVVSFKVERPHEREYDVWRAWRQRLGKKKQPNLGGNICVSRGSPPKECGDRFCRQVVMEEPGSCQSGQGMPDCSFAGGRRPEDQNQIGHLQASE